MTQKEKIDIIIKKIALIDDHLSYIRATIERLEDRILSLEEQLQSEYMEHRELIFESTWPGYESDTEDDDDDDED